MKTPFFKINRFVDSKLKDNIFSRTKMKYAIILATVQGSVLQKAGLEEGSKRYSQLMSMMQNFNPDFDEKKYWAYGCNCLVLGDRPMSDPGHGAPVDSLDTVCKKYKGKF